MRVRQLGRLRILLPAVCLALAGHAVVYGTLWPADGMHSYFSWYEPLFGGATIVALGGLLLLLLLGFAGSRRAKHLLAAVTTGRAPGMASAHRLALGGLAVLLVQETIESSVAAGRFVPGAFSVPSALLLLAFLWTLSFSLVYAARTYVRLARHAAASGRAPARAPRILRPARVVAFVWRPRPLAAGRALRAPPLLPG